MVPAIVVAMPATIVEMPCDLQFLSSFLVGTDDENSIDCKSKNAITHIVSMLGCGFATQHAHWQGRAIWQRQF
jgi:hypothetical protein